MTPPSSTKPLTLVTDDVEGDMTIQTDTDGLPFELSPTTFADFASEEAWSVDGPIGGFDSAQVFTTRMIVVPHIGDMSIDDLAKLSIDGLRRLIIGRMRKGGQQGPPGREVDLAQLRDRPDGGHRLDRRRQSLQLTSPRRAARESPLRETRAARRMAA